MAEIKTAIELAMERTKNLVMDDKEKQAFAQRETDERLRAIMRRFLEGIADEERFHDEYRRVEADDAIKRNILIGLIIEEFGESLESGRSFDLLEIVGRSAGEEAAQKVIIMEKDFLEGLEKKKASVRTLVERRLKEMGISGKSIEVNLDAWSLWQDAVQEAAVLFRTQLNEWKEGLQGTVS